MFSFTMISICIPNMVYLSARDPELLVLHSFGWIVLDNFGIFHTLPVGKPVQWVILHIRNWHIQV